MIQDCIDRESHMSEWEASFVDNIQNTRIYKGYRLSEKQFEILTKIWEKVTEDG